MKLRKKLIPFLVLTACLVLFCSMPVFAAELTEADVEAAVASQGKEAVTGNVFVWFLCAIAFLKVSQKIDSFLASLGINVGNTGGNMMAELLIAGRSLTGSMRSHGGGGYHKASSPGSAAVAGSFLSGGLAGAVGRQVQREAVNSATGYTEHSSIGNMLYQSSLNKGGDFANQVISNIAQGNYGQVGSIKGADAQKYGMEAYVELLMAVMMQESGGRGSDPMQAAEGGFNKKYPHVPNGITDPAYSIECGIQELKYALDKAGCTGPTDLDRIKLALQGYNYGSGYIDWAMERDGGYTKENAIAYSDMMCARPNWHYDRYGDKEYVEHVLRYYQITNTGGSYPANGMQIPHYLQTDYGNIPYGGGSIASSGCGPTSFAMIASYLTGNTITPPDAVAWCGNSYYKPGVGTYWSYFQAAASHFGCGSVTQTSNANTVLQALSEGCPVISSQRAGLFTSGGHFIVLRGVTANGKVLVNDPNDSDAKNYINREFDMMSEIHATANAYWIFDKK